MRRLIACLSAAALLTGFLIRTDSAAQNREGPTRFAQWMIQDAGALGSAIGNLSPSTIGGLTAAWIPVSTLDSEVNSEIREVSGRQFGSFLKLANNLGGPEIRLPLLGMFGASLITGNRRLQDAAFTSLQSWIYSGALSYGLKAAIGRTRPYLDQGPYDFKPFSGSTSFPSGHTSAAFAIVTPWVLYLDSPSAYALFALPAGTAIARLERDKHFVSDVMAGAALGIMTSVFLVRRHRKDTAHPDIPDWSPEIVVAPGEAGLIFTF